MFFHIDLAARHCELGITIGDKECWGRGYGREAVKLLLDYVFRVRNLRRVWLEVNAANERAIRAYIACGFVEEGRMREYVSPDATWTTLSWVFCARSGGLVLPATVGEEGGECGAALCEAG